MMEQALPKYPMTNHSQPGSIVVFLVVWHFMVSKKTRFRVFSGRRVTGFDQMPDGLLQALYEHLHFTRGRPNRSVHPWIRRSTATNDFRDSSGEDLANQAVLGIIRRGKNSTSKNYGKFNNRVSWRRKRRGKWKASGPNWHL
jgi:hypothetical protein